MAQTGFTPISLYYTTTAAAVPTAGNLVAGELAINTQDGKLFYKDAAGVVQVIAGKGGAGVAGGSTTQVQYNSSGSLVGSANMTFSGTALTLANDASISGLTVGKGGGSQATNTLLGNGSLTTASAGLRITAVGASVLTASTGNNNTGVGYLASGGNTTGYSNTATGSYALGLNLIGNNNTAVGSVSLYNNTADNNTAVGYESLRSNTTASNNTAVGYQAGYSNTTGQFVALGYQAGYSQTTATASTFIGLGAGYNATGGYNTFLGEYSGYYVTTGTKNTILGKYSGNAGGLDIRTASNYIVLSDGDGNPRVSIPTGTATATIPNATGTVMVSGNMPAVRAYLNANQTIPHNTATKVVFNAESFDTNNNFDTSNGRFTPTVAGYYYINSIVAFGHTTNAYIMLYKNGSVAVYGPPMLGWTGISGVSGIVSDFIYFNGSTDYIEIYGYQATGTNQVFVGLSTNTFIDIFLARAA
jgi:hypothetical protein